MSIGGTTVRELKAMLELMPNDLLVIIASDPEGNGHHSVHGVHRLNDNEFIENRFGGGRKDDACLITASAPWELDEEEPEEEGTE